jgi:hypothetical protein
MSKTSVEDILKAIQESQEDGEMTPGEARALRSTAGIDSHDASRVYRQCASRARQEELRIYRTVGRCSQT